MRVLIACEYSGACRRRAFRALGHDAWSIDLLDAEDGPTVGREGMNKAQRKRTRRRLRRMEPARLHRQAYALANLPAKTARALEAMFLDAIADCRKRRGSSPMPGWSRWYTHDLIPRIHHWRAMAKRDGARLP